MNKDRNTYLIIGLVFIALMVLYFSIEASLSHWVYNLDLKKKNPYGLYMTYQLVKEKYSPIGFEVNKDKNARDFMARKEPGQKFTYVYIGALPFFDSASVDTLLDLVYHGSTVFLACDELNERFDQDVLKSCFRWQVESNFSFGIDIMDDLFKTSSQPASYFNFRHAHLKSENNYTFYQKYKSDTIHRYFLNFEAISDTEPAYRYDPLNTVTFAGYQTNPKGRETGNNFGVFQYGKGRFVILLSALPFTNYYIRDARGLEYLEKVFSYLPADQPMIWDEYSREYHPDTEVQDQGNSEFKNSPLYFILQNKSLRMAWYLLLTLLLIFAVFSAKRRQKIIPVMEPKTNTSLQYVETIGQLYYEETEHQIIANEMKNQFFNYIRKKYFLPVQQLDADMIRILSVKTGVATGILEKLSGYFEDLRLIKSFNQSKLTHFNELLEEFYTTCK